MRRVSRIGAIINPKTYSNNIKIIKIIIIKIKYVQNKTQMRQKRSRNEDHKRKPVNLGTDRGYITSTPKSVNFAKKTQKRPNYERDSCMPGPKNGERPYLAPPKTQFLAPKNSCFFDPALRLSCRLVCHPVPISAIPTTEPTIPPHHNHNSNSTR